ncbi:MAG: PIN domain-containing protein [Chitinivibrionales bacterium]|nr:PIN domain-containing protein [Chitinivibrionales bacterium]
MSLFGKSSNFIYIFDYSFFGIVEWNEHLQNESISLIRKHQLKALDSIQLAAAKTAGPELFITSDCRLEKFAKKELKKVVFI